ncbi:MAG: EFR1 family ferrodoxin [Christensenellaceae bacterium]|jgi:ferredoxin|nr:EFR1 family ferrodoxin [Christensenellaceae bacterium]
MAKNLVFYFSGTGNSLHMAKTIAQTLGDTELFPLPAALRGRRPSEAAYERVGFVFPVYFWGMPNLVSRFLAQAELPRADYLFAAVNYGGLPGNCLGQLKRALVARGLPLHAAFSLKMPGNYLAAYNVFKNSERSAIAAQAKIERIAELILQKQPKNPPPLGFLFPSFSSSRAALPKKDELFEVSAACTGCGSCAALCPVQNIEPNEEGKPRFLHRCEQCMACAQSCPALAIGFRGARRAERRYKHPGVSWAELRAANRD